MGAGGVSYSAPAERGAVAATGAGREPAADELVRAEAQFVRAQAAVLEFARTERAWWLVADLTVYALLIAAAAVALIATPVPAAVGLLGSNAAALAWALRRRRRAPLG